MFSNVLRKRKKSLVVTRFIAVFLIQFFICGDFCFAAGFLGSEELKISEHCLSPRIAIFNSNLVDLISATSKENERLSIINEIKEKNIPKSLPTDNEFSKRTTALLLPISSIGSLGAAARKVTDWMRNIGFTKRMQLPTTATLARYGEPSPYTAKSAFAREVSLIDINEVPEMQSGDAMKWLQNNKAKFEELYKREKGKRRNSPAIARLIDQGLRQGFNEFKKLDAKNPRKEKFNQFVQRENKLRNWLDNYALFSALIDYHAEKNIKEPANWNNWYQVYKNRDEKALAAFSLEHADDIQFYYYEQFIIDQALADDYAYAHANGIAILGDMPIYVSKFSADAWAEPNIFMIDEQGNMLKETGCPPDYFSEIGQNWGGTPYKLNLEFKNWMRARIIKELQYVDELRLDHARWFQDLWLNLPGKDGIHGEWAEGLWLDFLKELTDTAARMGKRLFAEDLGSKVVNVHQLLDMTGLMGMKALVFGYSQGDVTDKTNSQIADEHHREDLQKAYSMLGTHDTKTWQGVWQLMDHKVIEIKDSENKNQELIPFYQGQRKALMQDIALKTNRSFNIETLEKSENLPPEVLAGLLDMLLASDAQTVVIPYWDIFGYGEKDRINVPGTEGDWGLYMFEDPQDLLDGKTEHIQKSNSLLKSLVLNNKRFPEEYLQTGEPKIVGSLPNINSRVPQVQTLGKDFTIFLTIAGEMPESVKAITNMPDSVGGIVEERQIKMEFLKEMPSGGWLYGINFPATEPGPWWLNFEINGKRSGVPGENTALFVTSQTGFDNRYTYLSDAKDVGLVINYNTPRKSFEIFISNYNEFTPDPQINETRKRSGYVHFSFDKNISPEDWKTDLNWKNSSNNSPAPELDLRDNLGIKNSEFEFYALVDRANGKVFIRSGKQLLTEGLFFSLGPEEIHRFRVILLENKDAHKLALLRDMHKTLADGSVNSLRDIQLLIYDFGMKLDFLSYGQVLSAAHLKNLTSLLNLERLTLILEQPDILIDVLRSLVVESLLTRNLEASI